MLGHFWESPQDGVRSRSWCSLNYIIIILDTQWTWCILRAFTPKNYPTLWAINWDPTLINMHHFVMMYYEYVYNITILQGFPDPETTIYSLNYCLSNKSRRRRRRTIIATHSIYGLKSILVRDDNFHLAQEVRLPKEKSEEPREAEKKYVFARTHLAGKHQIKDRTLEKWSDQALLWFFADKPVSFWANVVSKSEMKNLTCDTPDTCDTWIYVT